VPAHEPTLQNRTSPQIENAHPRRHPPTQPEAASTIATSDEHRYQQRSSSAARVFPRRLATGDDFLESVERHYQERRPSAQTRAAGVSPPWVQEPHLQRRRGTVRRIFARAPRAAGVSPPWLRIASATAIAHAPDGLSNQVWVRETHLQLVAKVAGWLLASVSPPWVGTWRVLCSVP
jgi:hypothetical protein